MVITDTLLICSYLACVLFDSASMHSYVSLMFATKFDRYPSKLNPKHIVGTSMGDYLLVSYIYKSCSMIVDGQETLADLMALGMYDLDMILGMDCWLHVMPSYIASLRLLNLRCRVRLLLKYKGIGWKHYINLSPYSWHEDF